MLGGLAPESVKEGHGIEVSWDPDHGGDQAQGLSGEEFDPTQLDSRAVRPASVLLLVPPPTPTPASAPAPVEPKQVSPRHHVSSFWMQDHLSPCLGSSFGGLVRGARVLVGAS